MRTWEQGLTWCFCALAVFLLGWSYNREAGVLSDVPRINHLGELVKLLDAKHVPLVVGVTGIVHSENPINCEFGGLRGVVVQQTATEKFLKRSDDGDWKQDATVVLSTCKEVPWYLDDGTGRVNVVGAQGASGFKFPASSGEFEQSKRCHRCESMDYSNSIKILGVKRVERVLPVGTSLSVIGEAVKDGVGTIRIQKPQKGPFYVSPKTMDELIEGFTNSARFITCVSFGLALIGTYYISVECKKYMMARGRRLELQRILRRAGAAAAVEPGENNEGSAEGASVATNGTNSCVICLEQENSVVFVPCGHICCCGTCCLPLTNCPLCRQRIAQVVRTFRS